MRSDVATRSGRRSMRRMSSGVALAAAAVVLSAGVAFPQEASAAGTGTISTIAGSDSFGDFTGDGGPAPAAALNEPLGVAVMPDGGYLIADAGNDRVRRVFADGTIRTVAGTGWFGDSGDGGPATAAQFNNVRGVALDGHGGLYVADASNSAITHAAPSTPGSAPISSSVTVRSAARGAAETHSMATSTGCTGSSIAAATPMGTASLSNSLVVGAT